MLLRITFCSITYNPFPLTVKCVFAVEFLMHRLFGSCNMGHENVSRRGLIQGIHLSTTLIILNNY
jgi:hypothetical protein